MRINWKIRIMNKTFWVTFIPSVLLVVQLILNMFGVKIDFGEIGNKLISLVDAIFALLAVIGATNDPTVAGLSDSVRAMGYEEPWEDIPNGEDPEEL